MNRKEAKRIIEQSDYFWIRPTPEEREALDMAIEALNAKCSTCKLCSDHQTRGTRCPIEERHLLLPTDGYCHLYDPLYDPHKPESEE